MNITTFDDLPKTVGDVVDGEPFSLGADDSNLFHRATWLDLAYAGNDQPEFPDTLVEGFWLLAMVDAVARFASPQGLDQFWGLNYGLDKVRFVSPVHFGDRISPTFETLEVTPKNKGYNVLRRCTFRVEGAERPAMVADWWCLVLPRGVFDESRREDI